MEYDEGEGNIEDGHTCYCCLEKIWKVDILKNELKGGNKLKMDREKLAEKVSFLEELKTLEDNFDNDFKRLTEELNNKLNGN